MRQITPSQCKVMQFGALTNKVSLFMNSFLVQQTLLQRSRETLTVEPVLMQSVCSAQGRPRPTRMSNTLLPMELEMAMSPRPEARRETLSRSVFGRETYRLRQAKLCCATLNFCFVSQLDLISASYVNVPCRATMTLAMQSGTLVPAARKVMPMMTSGMPRVKPITVT